MRDLGTIEFKDDAHTEREGPSPESIKEAQDALKDAETQGKSMCNPYRHGPVVLAKEILRLAAMPDAALRNRDGERYKWLKSFGEDYAIEIQKDNGQMGQLVFSATPQLLDDCIDAAMSQQEGKEKDDA